jgi:hypothetical protein
MDGECHERDVGSDVMSSMFTRVDFADRATHRWLWWPSTPCHELLGPALTDYVALFARFPPLTSKMIPTDMAGMQPFRGKIH